MSDIISFWIDCAKLGWSFGYGVFGFIEGTCVLLIAASTWLKSKHAAKVKSLEDPIMKWAAATCLVSFVFSTAIVAPAVQLSRVKSEVRRLEIANSNLLSRANLLFTKPEISRTFRAWWIDETNKQHEMFGSPTLSQIQDRIRTDSQYQMAIKFDVTNPNGLDVRVSGIQVEVKKFVAKKMLGMSLAGEATTRQFSCNIKTNTGFYECKRIGAPDFSYIKLKEKELEQFSIRLTCEDTGVFNLAIWIEYAVGDISKKVIVGELPNEIGFY